MTALGIDSSAAPLRRRLGPVPWFVLEELVLLAGADSVVETNVRALAAGLSLNKDTVARALGRLRAEGLVASDRQSNEAGRFGRGQYQTGPVPGIHRLVDDQPHPRSTQPGTPTPVPQTATSLQLRLIDDGADGDAEGPDPNPHNGRYVIGHERQRAVC
jgi:DNA-binding transcriptional ArsR family regulator